MREDWVEVELGKIFLTVTGNTPSKKDKLNYGNDVPFIKPPQLEDKPIYKANEFLSSLGAKKGRVLPKGSVFVTCIGNLGRTGLSQEFVAINQQINAIAPLQGIESKFTFYQCQNPYFRDSLEKLSSATTVAIVNKGKFNTIKIWIAPLPEQRAIIAKIEQLFSELDNGIANLKTAKDKLEIYRQAVLKKAFEGEFVSGKKANSLPKYWKRTSIAKLCNVVRGGSPRPAGDDRFYNGGIPFLKVADLTRSTGTHLTTYNFTIKEAGLKKTRYVAANTLLISNSGATLGVPKICVFPTTFNDGIAAFLGLDEDTLLYHYYFWSSKTLELRGINQGAAQPNLNTRMIGAVKIPIGPKDDLLKIVKEIETRLSVCDNAIKNINEALEKSKALRQSILKKAFEGKLLSDAELQACRKEADWEPAEKLLERIRKEKK